MTESALLRRVLAELLDLRNAHAPERAAAALAADVRYWDPDRGEVFGREAVAAALTAADARVEAETVAVAGEDAVMELQLQGADRTFRSTEVYRVISGRVTSIKAYLEPPAPRG
jgi:hypothetical protein